MDTESLIALAGVVVTASGVYVPTRMQVKASKLAKIEQLKKDREKELAAAVKPYQDRIDVLDQSVADLHEAQEEVIANGVKLWREQAAVMERDRDYWRGVAMGRAVSLTKQDDRDRRQDDTDHDNLEETP